MYLNLYKKLCKIWIKYIFLKQYVYNILLKLYHKLQETREVLLNKRLNYKIKIIRLYFIKNSTTELQQN